jgi:translocator protein
VKKKVKKFDWKTFLICLVIVFGISLIGSFFTGSKPDSEWFENVRPSITPPNYLFGIVWPILYFLIATSLYFVWVNANVKQKKKIVLIFGLNLFLNALWSIFYFGLQNVFLSFIDIIFILITIILMIQLSFKINQSSSYLLIPYLLWVCFATLLNFLSVLKVLGF